MSMIRRLGLLSLAVLVVAAVAAAPASAAKFTPAGHSFTATAAPASFAFTQASPSGYHTIACANSATGGTLSNPASATANVTAPTFGSCSVQPSIPGYTVTATTSGSWQLQANSTTAVSLKGGSIVLRVSVLGSELCTLTASSPTIAGSWSNALQRLTFNWAANTIVFSKTGNSFFCPGPAIPATSAASLTGTYNIANTTVPAIPITVQP